MDMSPENFSLEGKRLILDDIISSSTAIENALREDFARPDEARLLDGLGTSNRRGRDRRRRMFMDSPQHRDRPTI